MCDTSIIKATTSKAKTKKNIIMSVMQAGLQTRRRVLKGFTSRPGGFSSLFLFACANLLQNRLFDSVAAPDVAVQEGFSFMMLPAEIKPSFLAPRFPLEGSITTNPSERVRFYNEAKIRCLFRFEEIIHTQL